MNEPIIFIYAINNKIKALDQNQSRKEHLDLINSGWVHTRTLHACDWIEYIYGCDPVDMIQEIKNLSKPVHEANQF